MVWSRIYRALLTCVLTLLTIGITIRVCSAITDSSDLLQPKNLQPLTTPMSYSNITATIVVTVPNAVKFIGGACSGNKIKNIFYIVAVCTTGSVPRNSSDDVITAADLKTCFDGGICKPTIISRGTIYNDSTQTCNGGTNTYQYKASTGITTRVTCNLALQGWFPASDITPLYAITPVGSAAPTNNFNFGILQVSYTSCGQYGCQCNIPTTPKIPGGYQLCLPTESLQASWYPYP